MDRWVPLVNTPMGLDLERSWSCGSTQVLLHVLISVRTARNLITLRVGALERFQFLKQYTPIPHLARLGGSGEI